MTCRSWDDLKISSDVLLDVQQFAVALNKTHHMLEKRDLVQDEGMIRSRGHDTGSVTMWFSDIVTTLYTFLFFFPFIGADV